MFDKLLKNKQNGFCLFTDRRASYTKKTEKKKLKNFPSGYLSKFYRNLEDNDDSFLRSDFYGRIANDVAIPSEAVQKYLLATSDFSKGMQDDINHYITRNRINNASFRQKLDAIVKNILRRQNHLELVFQDISTFDAENAIVGSLLRELNLGKKDTASDLIKNVPQLPGIDFIIRNRLNKLRNNGNKNNDDSGLSPPPSPPPSNNFQQPSPPPPSSFNNFSPPPPLPPLPPQPRFGSQTMVATKPPKEKIIDEIDNAVYEIPDPAKPELRDLLLREHMDISADDYVNDKVIEEKTIEQLKDEYKFDEIKDAFDEGAVPHQLEFLYGGDDENFMIACTVLSLNENNNDFV